MHTRVIGDASETGHPGGWGRCVQQREQLPQEAIVFARAETLKPCTGLPRPGSRQRGLFVLAWRQELCLRAVQPPGGSHLRQEVHSACIRHHHACMRWQGAREPGHAEGRLPRDGALPLWVHPDAEAPGAIRLHDALHTGARAQQDGRHLRRVAARRTQL
jgi:hypothetical protein